MNKMNEVFDENYVPNNEDILRSRQNTIGASTTLIYFKKLWWRFVDVGGHVPERRKWEAIIENVHSIDVLIYFAALDDFLIDSEEKGKTQMDMSIKIWEESLNDQALSTRKSTILFLNKMDLFEELFQKKKIFKKFKKCYKDYDAGQDHVKAAEYIRDKFIGISDNIPNCKVTAHCTCGINTKSMKEIWFSIQADIIELRLNRGGF